MAEQDTLPSGTGVRLLGRPIGLELRSRAGRIARPDAWAGYYNDYRVTPSTDSSCP